MSDENCDLASTILMLMIIVFGLINICVMSVFLVSSVVTYMNDEDSYPYMDGVAINNKPDTKIYCDGEMVIRINDPVVCFQLTPGETYTINCQSHDCLISEENVTNSHVLPGEDASSYRCAPDDNQSQHYYNSSPRKHRDGDINNKITTVLQNVNGL